VLDLKVGSGSQYGCGHPMQEPLPEQIKFGAPVPQTCDQLNPADLPFTLTGAPGRGQRGHDRGIILVETAGQGTKRRETRSLGLLQPPIERGWIMLGQQSVKAGLQLVPPSQQGMSAQALLDGVPVHITQMTSRLEDEPGDPRGG
jgi:hypothetical protein